MTTAKRTLEKKREILQAASRVFRRSGLQGAGMREIAAELGMYAGNIYYYFENKEALLAFCQEDALSGLLKLAKKVGRRKLPADQKLFLLVVGHVVLLNESTPGSLAHLEVEALGEPYRGQILAQRDAYAEALRKVIEEGAASQRLRPTDAKVAALTLLGAMNWTVKWFNADGGKNATQIGEELAELLVRGLLADGVAFEIPDLSPLAKPVRMTAS